jgi:hypothetical protein
MEGNRRGPDIPVLLWREQVKPGEIQIGIASLGGRCEPPEYERGALPARVP